jgi:hypothetical protein
MKDAVHCRWICSHVRKMRQSKIEEQSTDLKDMYLTGTMHNVHVTTTSWQLSGTIAEHS